MPDAYVYLFLDLFTILGPLALSFDKKVAFYKDWKWLLPSLFIVSGLYLLWDIWFTSVGIWEFNFRYLLGPSLFGLPLEEYGFFIVVPYACLFIYRCLQVYFPNLRLPNQLLYYGTLLLSAIIFIASWGKLYTSVTFGLITLSMIGIRISIIWKKLEHYFGHLWLAWIISMIPMFYVNGKLTALPVLEYNNTENLGIRIGTIPLEDFFYNFLYMFLMIILFETFKRKSYQKK